MHPTGGSLPMACGLRGGRSRPGADPLLAAVCILIAILMSATAPASLQAQDRASEWTAPRWMGDVAFVGTNALFGGLSAGLMQHLEGGDFRDGFTRGAFGGVTAYAGRRIAAAEFSGAGLVGRQVSAVGSSVVRNAGEGRPSLERLVFPVGPVRLYVDRARETEVRPRVAVYDLAWLVTFATRSETKVDWSQSLSSGAPVFRSPQRSFKDHRGEAVDGLAAGGSIGLSDAFDDRLRQVVPHERVHVLQHDFAFLVWSDPVEKRLLESHRWTRGLARHVDLGLLFPLLRNGVYRGFDVPHSRQLAEIEAMFLDRGAR